MYILIKKEPLNVMTFETKTDLANYIKVHRNTVTNRFEEKESWECEKGMVYKSNQHFKRIRKGNKDSNDIKLKKKNCEIPCKNLKLDKSCID